MRYGSCDIYINIHVAAVGCRVLGLVCSNLADDGRVEERSIRKEASNMTIVGGQKVFPMKGQINCKT